PNSIVVLLFISTRGRDRLRGGSSARPKLPGRSDRPWLTWPVEGVGQLRQQLWPLGLFRRHEQPPPAERPAERDTARVHGHGDRRRQRRNARSPPRHEAPVQR